MDKKKPVNGTSMWMFKIPNNIVLTMEEIDELIEGAGDIGLSGISELAASNLVKLAQSNRWKEKLEKEDNMRGYKGPKPFIMRNKHDKLPTEEEAKVIVKKKTSVHNMLVENVIILDNVIKSCTFCRRDEEIRLAEIELVDKSRIYNVNGVPGFVGDIKNHTYVTSIPRAPHELHAANIVVDARDKENLEHSTYILSPDNKFLLPIENAVSLVPGLSFYHDDIHMPDIHAACILHINKIMIRTVPNTVENVNAAHLGRVEYRRGNGVIEFGVSMTEVLVNIDDVKFTLTELFGKLSHLEITKGQTRDLVLCSNPCLNEEVDYKGFTLFYIGNGRTTNKIVITDSKGNDYYPIKHHNCDNINILPVGGKKK